MIPLLSLRFHGTSNTSAKQKLKTCSGSGGDVTVCLRVFLLLWTHDDNGLMPVEWLIPSLPLPTRPEGNAFAHLEPNHGRESQTYECGRHRKAARGSDLVKVGLPNLLIKSQWQGQGRQICLNEVGRRVITAGEGGELMTRVSLKCSVSLSVFGGLIRQR